MSWHPDADVSKGEIAADATVVFSSGDGDLVTARLPPSARADLKAASSGSASLFHVDDSRVVVVKLKSKGGSDSSDAAPASTASATLDSLRSGTSAAISRLRGLQGVTTVAVDLRSVASALKGVGSANAEAASQSVVQATLLTNYSFDKYATATASKLKMSVLKHVVRDSFRACLHAQAYGLSLSLPIGAPPSPSPP